MRMRMWNSTFVEELCLESKQSHLIDIEFHTIDIISYLIYAQFSVNRMKKMFHSEFRFTLYIHITLGGVFHCPCHCFNCCPLHWDPTLTKNNKTDLSNGEINGYFNKFRLKAEICLDIDFETFTIS